MKRLPVRSSSLKAVGYDPATETLEIEFRRGGRLVRYVGVSAAVYQAFLVAPSKALFVEHVLENSGYR